MSLLNNPPAVPYVPGLEFTFTLGEFSLRAGRVDLFLRRRAPYDPRWFFLREPNNIELFAFGLALVVSWGPWRSGEAS